jgi:hypothetical protein
MEGRDISAEKYTGMRAVKLDDGDVSYSAVTKSCRRLKEERTIGK